MLFWIITQFVGFAETWQCPGHEPSVQMQVFETLDVPEMDRYRGYKPAWMALESEYRTAVFKWDEQSIKSAYLENHNNYLDPYMYQERLSQLMTKYEGQVKVWQIASTHFGFPVFALLIGDHSKTNKPSITHTYAIHGNELIGVNYGLDAIEFLLDHPSERKAITQDFNLWFVPMVNPDGVWLSMRRAHASTYGKKNGRNTDGTCEPYAYEGVNISANFPTLTALEPQELEAETIALMELLSKNNSVALLSVHTGGNGWYTPDVSKDETGMMTSLIDGFGTDMVEVLADAEVKRLRSNSDLGEVRWFYENFHFPAFIYEYPNDLAPMDHEVRETARSQTLDVTKSYWETLQKRAFVRGIVVDQEGDLISDATIHLSQTLRKEFTWDVSEMGEFALLLPGHDVYSLKIRAAGYINSQKKVDVRGGSAEIRIVLQQEE